MNTLTTLAAVLLFGAVAYIAWRAMSGLLSRAQYAEESARQLARKLAEAKAQQQAQLDVIERHAGGIGKRISETREIAEAVFANNPAIFAAAPGLIYWLKASDDFLVELMRVSHSDTEFQRHAAEARTAAIYQQVIEAIHLPGAVA